MTNLSMGSRIMNPQDSRRWAVAGHAHHDRKLFENATGMPAAWLLRLLRSHGETEETGSDRATRCKIDETVA